MYLWVAWHALNRWRLVAVTILLGLTRDWVRKFTKISRKNTASFTLLCQPVPSDFLGAVLTLMTSPAISACSVSYGMYVTWAASRVRLYWNRCLELLHSRVNSSLVRRWDLVLSCSLSPSNFIVCTWLWYCAGDSREYHCRNFAFHRQIEVPHLHQVVQHS